MRFDIVAGPICLNPKTEQESFIWSMVIFGTLIALQWLFILIFLAVFKYRKTFNDTRKNALKITLGLHTLFFAVSFLGSVSTSAISKIESGSNCVVADNSAFGNILFIVSLLILFSSLITSLFYIFSFNKKSVKQ